MYKLFLYTSVFTLIFCIIWVGVESIQIKVVLGIIGLTFLIPQIRKNLYKTPLVIRKSKVALYTSLAFTFLFFSLDLKQFINDPIIIDFTYLTVILFVFFSSSLGIFIYGIPVSLLTDLLTAKFKNYRTYLSFLLHIGFGLLTFLFLGPGMILATICSFIFFLLDELIRKRESRHLI